MLKHITKIVITGGPCSGKTTAMSWIQNSFKKKGYFVIFVPEVATEIIGAGFSPISFMNIIQFQKFIIEKQLANEKIYTEYANQICNYDKILMVCDRGSLDGKAYMSENDFTKMLNDLNLNETSLRDNYDAVFHLVTAAKGAEEFYTLENNSARTETAEQASLLDDKLISAWTGHPHYKIIDNSCNFEEKMKRLISEITNFLGEPIPFEHERKFLIKYPIINILENNENCKKIQMLNTYLKSNSDEEIRICQRGEKGYYTYYKITKIKTLTDETLELEERLSQNEYLDLLLETDYTKHQIRKTRYCLTYENHYIQIDLYPFWSDKALMEIEFNNPEDTIPLPIGIEIIKEVTNISLYRNSHLAEILSEKFIKE